MRFWHFSWLFIFIISFLVFLVGCGPGEVKGPVPTEEGNTLSFSVRDAYVAFDIDSGRFCFWSNKTKRVFCTDIDEYRWVPGQLIEDAEPK